MSRSQKSAPGVLKMALSSGSLVSVVYTRVFSIHLHVCCDICKVGKDITVLLAELV